jgi:hypothetical protein
MNSPVVRIIAALIITGALLIYLFHGSVASMQQPTYSVHSTLQPGQAK